MTLTPLSSALILVVALLIVLSGFYAARAETARVQHVCAGWAAYELGRGRMDRAAAYIEATKQAYITGGCWPHLQLRVEVEP